MNKPDKIFLSLIGTIALLVFALVFTLFRKSGNDNYPYKELLAAKDSAIQLLKHERETIEAELIERQISLDALETLDSVTYSHYRQQQAIYKLLDEKYKSIPSTIKRIAGNNDSIRAIYHQFE
jgi:hypothetical protein